MLANTCDDERCVRFLEAIARVTGAARVGLCVGANGRSNGRQLDAFRVWPDNADSRETLVPRYWRRRRRADGSVFLTRQNATPTQKHWLAQAHLAWWLAVPLDQSDPDAGLLVLAGPQHTMPPRQADNLELLHHAAAAARHTVSCDDAIHEHTPVGLRHLQTMVEHAPDIVIYLDRNRRIIYMNRTATGGPVEQQVGTRIDDWVDEDFRSHIDDVTRKVFEQANVARLTLQARGDDAVPRWYAALIGPVVTDGRTDQAIVVARDISEQRRTHERLRKSEAMFRTITENVPDAIVRIDRNYRLRYVNRTLTERSPDQILGRRAMDLVAPEYRATLRDALNRAFERGESTDLQVHRTVDQSTRQFEMRLVPLMNDQIDGALIIGQDITERLDRENALHQSEQRFRSITEHAPFNILMLDDRGRITFINRTVPGLSSDDLIGTEAWQWAAPDHQKVSRRFIETVLKTNRPVRYEVEGLGPHGRLHWYEVHMSPIAVGGRVRQVVACSIDITRRKEAEQALRESEERLRTAFENMPGDFWIRDAEDRCLLQNAASREHWGRQIGRTSDRTTVDDETRAIWRANNQRALSGEVVRGEVRMKVGDEYRFFHNVVAPWRVGGEIRGIIGFNIDITDRKRAEQALQETHEQLEQRVRQRTRELTEANRKLRDEIEERKQAQDALRRSERLATIGTLAAGIAHEVNNPLAAILVAAHIGQSHETPPDQMRPLFEQIAADTRRCSRIVKSVLQFARHEKTGRWPCAVCDMAAHARDMVRKTADRAVKIDIDCDDNLPTVSANPTEIEQVLTNLINNAIEAGASRVMITARPGPIKGRVQVRIKDDGHGMDDQQLRHALDPFYTAPISKGGTGLGLSVSHGIVKAHGGDLRIQSTPGNGAQVSFDLPVAVVDDPGGNS